MPMSKKTMNAFSNVKAILLKENSVTAREADLVWKVYSLEEKKYHHCRVNSLVAACFFKVLGGKCKEIASAANVSTSTVRRNCNALFEKDEEKKEEKEAKEEEEETPPEATWSCCDGIYADGQRCKSCKKLRHNVKWWALEAQKHRVTMDENGTHTRVVLPMEKRVLLARRKKRKYDAKYGTGAWEHDEKKFDAQNGEGAFKRWRLA